jgi:4-hydroxybenzoate polyprenyltransferase
MNKGQFIGSLIDAGFWIAAGVFVQFFLARHIQKRIEQGKETPDKAERIKKNGKWIGWLLILLGVVKLTGVFLGHS